jgi:hypothetical protein
MRIFLFLLAIPAAFGQLFSAGIKVGVPMTDSFADITSPGLSTGQLIHSFSDSKKFIVGPMVELHLPFGISIAADGLYRPLRLTMISTNPGIAATGQNSANYASWEVTPVLRYRFLHTPIVKPFAESGPSFRFVETPLDHNLSDRGFTLGGGVEVKLLLIRITPELRFTRWGNDHNVVPTFPLQSGQNQAEFLVGFAFKP